jgi:hypothetical protein
MQLAIIEDDERTARLRSTLFQPPAPIYSPPTILEPPSVSAQPVEPNWPRVTRRSWPLTILAYSFGALGIGINIWNAAGALPDMILPAALGAVRGRDVLPPRPRDDAAATP